MVAPGGDRDASGFPLGRHDRLLRDCARAAADGSGPRRDANLDGGYAIDVPWTWRAAPRGGLPSGQSITSYQVPQGGSAFTIALTVSVGDAAGTITLCDPRPSEVAGIQRLGQPRCRAVRATTLDQLDAELSSIAPRDGSTERQELVLGGESGRLEVPHQRQFIAVCIPNQSYYAYAFHDGRPIVLRMPYCRAHGPAPRDRDEPWGPVASILASLSFLD